MPCLGCEARKEELEHLRRQVADLQDRLLAATNPQAYAQVSGKGLQTPGAPAVEYHTTDDGQTWVILDGKSVRLEDYQRLLTEHGGYLDGTGKFIPAAEYNAVASKLAESLGEQAVTEQMLSGSYRAQ